MAGSDRPSLLVAGGGVIGCAIALALLDRGWRVTVADKGAIGQEASVAAGGMLCPGAEVWDRSASAEIFAQSGALHRPWSEDLEERSGIDVGYLPSGLLRVAMTDAEAEALSQDAARRAPAVGGLGPEYLDGPALRSLEPALAADAAGGLLFPKDAQLRPVDLMRALRLALVRSGACLREGLPVLSLIEERGRVTGAQTAAGPLHADLTVLAAGAWSAPLAAPWLGLAIAPVKGQLLSVRADSLTLHHMVAGPRIVLPRMDGTFTLGATLERVGFDRRATVTALADIHAGASRVVPGLRQAAFERTWTGLRPQTPDELPYVGPVPSLPGLLVAAGHFTYGIFLAPLTARIVAALATGERPPVDIENLRPERHATPVPASMAEG